MEKVRKSKNLLENLFIIVLAFYPLRHINWGLDLWDTGYNYSNFQYMGTEHMDPMWLFSTYLSNAVGNLLMKLPCADHLSGMNFYTGLFVSLLALAGYFFCTRALKMPGWIAFAGELIAVSLCWCPTAVLYNYLTYVFMLASVILLYQGLTKGKNVCLALAGVCLGANVLVRFSNLPEAALILAVWIYDVLVWRREKQEASAPGDKLWRRLGLHTFWCFTGYVSSLAVLFGYIHFRYGITNYVSGIRRLFAMTSDNTEYKPYSMLTRMLEVYWENMYWVIRIGVILTVGILFFVIADQLKQLCGKRKRLCWWCGRLLLASVGAAALAWLCMKFFYSSESMMASFADYEKLFHPAVLFAIILPAGLLLSAVTGYLLQKRFGTERAFGWEIRVLWMAVCAAMLVWLYMKGFCTMDFFLTDESISYGPMLRPGILFLMLAMLTGMIRICSKNSSEGEKLISIMVILVVLVTSIGSNNRLFPSINNLFLAAPFTLWQGWRFCRNVKEKRMGRITVSAFPVKGILTAFIGLCLFQFTGFGAKFAFAEASGVYNITASVENNEILKNIKMSPEKAQWMTELSDYVNEHGLQGREVILYGYIPSLSYYLQMPPAFNSWIDLASYSHDSMENDLKEIETQIREDGADPPVVLVNYLQSGMEVSRKWEMLQRFMERNGYELVWQDDRFTFYEAVQTAP